ncbi:MAG: MFS transporter [Actinomycetes bacterium]
MGARFRRRLPPALRSRDYALLWVALLVSNFGTQMTAVAVGWQVYAIHRSALDLGLVGLCTFIPLPLLALPAGHLSDRFSRRRIFAIATFLETGVVALLLVVSLSGARQLWPFLALAAATGTTAAIGIPPGRALPAMVVPYEIIQSAMALRAIAFQIAVITGPALGGFLFIVSPQLVYGIGVGMLALGVVAILAVDEPRSTPLSEPLSLNSVFAGIRFIRATPVLLGAITLDLFAVLFGGAIALAPVFARTILHTGPAGLGLLRSAPAVGAVAAGVLLAHRPLRSHAGRTLLIVVAIFGATQVVFGLSNWLWLSLLALAISGFVDMYSMNIRGATVALATPDELRGRVLAVEMVFISASNELGAFESGAAAALFGTVASVVAGGAVTIGLAGASMKLWPALARIDRLEDLRPDGAGAIAASG